MAVLARTCLVGTPLSRYGSDAGGVRALAEDRFEDEMISRTGERKRGSPYEFRARVSTFTGTKQTEGLF
jgi:hypothetical protein